MFERIPAIIAAVCLTIYWFWVVVKLVQLGWKLGKDPNAMPREKVGQLMRLLWYPCIGALLVGLWWAAFGNGEGLVGWMWAPSPAWWAVVIPATVICVGCTMFTFVCWHKMGRSWRIGIDPDEKLELVSTGPYKWVRHPIYALRMVINLCAFVMAPTPLVALTAGIDFLLLQIEARREEKYMLSKHPQEYGRYQQEVGRFVPRKVAV